MTKVGFFETTKTARYSQLGEFCIDTRTIWIVLHGYGQLAPFFVNKFDCLVSDQTVVIAPEGLHRFYLTGVSGRVGASWMTKEDRLNDINDYVKYLNSLVKYLVSKHTFLNPPQINVLGFSQGGATACRWVSLTPLKIDKLILYSSVFPPDLNFDADGLKRVRRVIAVMGNQDEYVKLSDFENEMKKTKKLLNTLEYFVFEGKHEILPEVLIKLKE